MPILFFEESSSDKKLRALLETRNLTALDSPKRLALDEQILDHIKTMSLDPNRHQELKDILDKNQEDDDYLSHPT